MSSLIPKLGSSLLFFLLGGVLVHFTLGPLAYRIGAVTLYETTGTFDDEVIGKRSRESNWLIFNYVTHDGRQLHATCVSKSDKIWQLEGKPAHVVYYEKLSLLGGYNAHARECEELGHPVVRFVEKVSMFFFLLLFFVLGVVCLIAAAQAPFKGRERRKSGAP